VQHLDRRALDEAELEQAALQLVDVDAMTGGVALGSIPGTI